MNITFLYWLQSYTFWWTDWKNPIYILRTLIGKTTSDFTHITNSIENFTLTLDQNSKVVNSYDIHIRISDTDAIIGTQYKIGENM